MERGRVYEVGWGGENRGLRVGFGRGGLFITGRLNYLLRFHFLS